MPPAISISKGIGLDPKVAIGVGYNKRMSIIHEEDEEGYYYEEEEEVVEEKEGDEEPSKPAMEHADKMTTEYSQQRKVTFTFVKIILLEDVPLASRMDESEKQKLWWNTNELDIIEESVKKVVSSVKNGPGGKSTQQNSMYQRILKRLYHACSGSNHEDEVSILHLKDIDDLAEWHRNSHSKRGLEILVLGNEKQNTADVRETLLHAFKLIEENQEIKADRKEESIRACSEKMTRQARLFAKVLAAADAACIHHPIARTRCMQLSRTNR